MKHLFLGVLVFFSLIFTATAQKPVCGFDILQQQLRTDPNYRQAENNTNTVIQAKVNDIIRFRKLMQNLNVLSSGIYEVPVVVHVIYKSGDAIPGSASNPTDAKIQEALDRLNNDFAGGSPGNLGAGMPIRFALAKRTPNCQSTSGIERIDGSGVSGYNTDGVAINGATGASQSDIKNLSTWPPKMYYNMWIVHKINAPDLAAGTYISGFATLPITTAGELHVFPSEGMMIVGKDVRNTSSTLTHELGHAMGLYHTFQGNDPLNIGSNDCPANTTCATQGDLVCDTDPVKNLLLASPFPIDTDINPCTSVAYSGAQRNIMGYGSVANQFTNGQSTRMQAVFDAVRNGFASSQATLSPPTELVRAANQIPPTITNNSNNGNIGPCNVILGDLKYNSYGFNQDDYLSYIDNSCNIGTHLSKSADATLSVTTQSYTQRVKVWIDFNNDGSFDNASGSTELVMNHLGSTIPETHTATILSSTLSAAGTKRNKLLRMRVMADWSSSPDFNAGSTLQYGQTEDFWVQVDASLNVTFGNINAIFKNNTLNINWNTETEENNDHFLVEGSKDGSNFFTLQSINSKAENGNSTNLIQYNLNINSNNGSLASGIGMVIIAIIFIAAAFGKKKKIALAACICLAFLIACNKNDLQTQNSDDEIKFIRITQVDKNGVKNFSKTVRIVKD